MCQTVPETLVKLVTTDRCTTLVAYLQFLPCKQIAVSTFHRSWIDLSIRPIKCSDLYKQATSKLSKLQDIACYIMKEVYAIFHPFRMHEEFIPECGITSFLLLVGRMSKVLLCWSQEQFVAFDGYYQSLFPPWSAVSDKALAAVIALGMWLQYLMPSSHVTASTKLQAVTAKALTNGNIALCCTADVCKYYAMGTSAACCSVQARRLT
jgi:hypothetical protein